MCETHHFRRTGRRCSAGLRRSFRPILGLRNCAVKYKDRCTRRGRENLDEQIPGRVLLYRTSKWGKSLPCLLERDSFHDKCEGLREKCRQTQSSEFPVRRRRALWLPFEPRKWDSRTVEGYALPATADRC